MYTCTRVANYRPINIRKRAAAKNLTSQPSENEAASGRAIFIQIAFAMIIGKATASHKPKANVKIEGCVKRSRQQAHLNSDGIDTR